MSDEKQNAEKTQRGLVGEIKELTSRVADLEAIIDEIPSLGTIFNAVKEIQEMYDAPAATFIHYLGGSRI